METIKRAQFKFWLDVTKKQEYELALQCDDLRHKRQFAKTIREGIRLILDLRQGRTAVLFELFPHLAQQLQPAKDDKLDTVIALLQSQQATPMLVSAISHQQIAPPTNNGMGFTKTLGGTDLGAVPSFGLDLGSNDLEISAEKFERDSTKTFVDSFMDQYC
jgi:hypothetical protein